MNPFKKIGTGAGRGLQYRAPVDSALTEPPRSSEIVYWMVLDGRRMQRHSNPLKALLSRRARPKVLYSALITVPVLCALMFALLLGLAPVVIALSGLAWLTLGYSAAGIILGCTLVGAATIAGMYFLATLSNRICQPYLKARGVSYDEELAGMIMGLAPLVLLALIVMVIV